MDVMVTARMPAGKKDAGNSVLAQMGVTPSRAINQLYDYLIERGSLPFGQADEHDRAQLLSEAVAWTEELSQAGVDPRFFSMDDDAIRRERLASRGLIGGVER